MKLISTLNISMSNIYQIIDTKVLDVTSSYFPIMRKVKNFDKSIVLLSTYNGQKDVIFIVLHYKPNIYIRIFDNPHVSKEDVRDEIVKMLEKELKETDCLRFINKIEEEYWKI